MAMLGFSTNANESRAKKSEIATQRIAETRTIPVAPRSLVAIEAGTILKSAHATMSNTDIA